jgi:hypothetical protein
MEDEDQIGPISGNMVLPKRSWTNSLLRRLVSVAPIEDTTANRKNPAAPPGACTINYKKWI